ncbi:MULTISPECIES: hypothetical protein [unclassified Tolypothrix]|nr:MULTISPECIES: hypothetical protein [unclassified Tolypothrix]
MNICGWMFLIVKSQGSRVIFLITHYPLPITHYPLPITHYPLPFP